MRLMFLILVLMLVYCTETKLPPYIHVCKRTDPNLTQCIIDSVTSLNPQLKKGIPELQVPGIEPLALESIKLRSGPSNAKIDANITNLLVWGPSTYQVSDLNINLDKNRFLFKLLLPHIYFKGDYDIDMKVLILKYKGQGPITGNFTDLNMEVLLKGRVMKINGNNHIQFRKFGIHVNLSHAYIHLENLFAHQQHLGAATNQVVNENSDVFINEIKPALESSLAEKFTEVANIICKTFTYDELFPN